MLRAKSLDIFLCESRELLLETSRYEANSISNSQTSHQSLNRTLLIIYDPFSNQPSNHRITESCIPSQTQHISLRRNIQFPRKGWNLRSSKSEISMKNPLFSSRSPRPIATQYFIFATKHISHNFMRAQSLLRKKNVSPMRGRKYI